MTINTHDKGLNHDYTIPTYVCYIILCIIYNN